MLHGEVEYILQNNKNKLFFTKNLNFLKVLKRNEIPNTFFCTCSGYISKKMIIDSINKDLEKRLISFELMIKLELISEVKKENLFIKNTFYWNYWNSK